MIITNILLRTHFEGGELMGSVGANTDWRNSIKWDEKSKFFGDISSVSNKYFYIKNQVLDDDNIIVFTNNVKAVKGNPVLIIDNNKAVYLKDFNLNGVRIKDGEQLIETYAVKLNRNYFKPYTFKSDFNDVSFDKADTFDSLKNISKAQEKTKKQISTFSIDIYKNYIQKH